MNRKSTISKRAFSPAEIISKRYKVADFQAEWLSLIGKPELAGTWLVWGGSFQGKTSFCLLLADYLTQFGRVAYNTLELGISNSLKEAIIKLKLEKSKILFLNKEMPDELKARLSKKSRTPDIIIIDSLQYFDINYQEYKQLKAQFRNKLFIYISHAEGDNPRNSTAQAIRYDADVKIFVKGFKAFAQSRYGGGQPYTIWKEKADEYWVE